MVSMIESDADKLIAKARQIPKMDGFDLAKEVSTKRPYVREVGERSHEPVAIVGVEDLLGRVHVVAYDFGIKQNILRKAARRRMQSHGRPGADFCGRCARCAGWSIPLERPRRSRAMHICCRFDPPPPAGRQPIFGIRLGRQLIGIALGGKT